MNENKLVAQLRKNIGKGPSRKLRADKQLPAVVYAKGQETLPVTICPNETTKILRGPLRRNSLINLQIEGESNKRLVMVKERQIHPTRRSLVHVDFVEVDVNKPVMVSVPLLLTGKSESVTLGGKLDHVLKKIRVNCVPTKVPEAITVDITHLPFGSTHTKDVTLPEGLSLAEKPRVVVLTIKKPRGAQKDEANEGTEKK